MTRDKLNISLNIAGEYVDLTISPAEEAIYREAADSINTVWRRWSSQFPNHTAQHIMARVSLLFAQGYLLQRQANGDVDTMLSELDDEFDRLLRQGLDA